MLPNLYTFIWAKLRQNPTGENVGQSEWPLRVSYYRTCDRLLFTGKYYQDTLEAFLGEENFCSEIHDKILCKHAVDLFISVNKFMINHQ